MRVTLLSSDFGLGYELCPVSRTIGRKLEKATGSESILFQTDWDFPSLAQSLGWSMRSRRCDHRSTDGTVTCSECGKTAPEFIAEAQEWLDARVYRNFQNTGADAYIENALGY